MTDEILVVFLTAALSAPIETRHRMCRETDGDDWGWKSHLRSQPPHTHTHTHTWGLRKVLHWHGSACISLRHRVYELHEICILQINYAKTGLWLCYTHTSTHTHSHTLAKVLSVLQLGTQLQWCHCSLPLCWLWLLLKAEHFDSASRAVTVHGWAQAYTQHANTKIDCMHYAHIYTNGSYHQHIFWGYTHTHTHTHIHSALRLDHRGHITVTALFQSRQTAWILGRWDGKQDEKGGKQKGCAPDDLIQRERESEKKREQEMGTQHWQFALRAEIREVKLRNEGMSPLLLQAIPKYIYLPHTCKAMHTNTYHTGCWQTHTSSNLCQNFFFQLSRSDIKHHSPLNLPNRHTRTHTDKISYKALWKSCQCKKMQTYENSSEQFPYIMVHLE